MNEKVEKLRRQYFVTASVVAAFWIISIGTGFVNKSLLGDKRDLVTPSPICKTWIHCVVSSIVCLILTKLGRYLSVPPAIGFPDIKINLEDVIKTLSVSFAFISMDIFKNVCLLHFGVPFYDLARSLTMVTNIAITHLLMETTVSKRAGLCCIVITCGHLLGIDQGAIPDGMTIPWICLGISLSFLTSAHAILTKKCLPTVNNCIWTLTCYNNLIGSLLLTPTIFILGEHPTIMYKPQELELRFWAQLVIGSVCGLSVAAVTILQIKVTSALTHNVSETAAASFRTIIDVWKNSENKASVWWGSNLIGFIGSIAFTKVQQMDMEEDYLFPRENTDDSNAEESSNAEGSSLQDSEDGY